MISLFAVNPSGPLKDPERTLPHYSVWPSCWKRTKSNFYFPQPSKACLKLAWQLDENSSCDSAPPHVLSSQRAPRSLFLPAIFVSVLSGHGCSGKHRLRTANESQQREWYTVFTLYGTHQTRFTQFFMFAVKTPLLLTLSGLYFPCLRVFYTGIRSLATQREKKKIARVVLARLRLSWETGICRWRPV